MPLGRSEAKAVQGLFGFLFGQGRGQQRRRRPGSSTRLSKDNPVCVLPVGLWVLASSLAGESAMKELSRVFWKLLVSASECGPPPSFSIVSSEIDTNMLWGKIGSKSGDQSLRSQTIVISVPAGPLTPAFPEGVARAGVLASAAAFEYWPLSHHGLLISPGFQAAGGSSGHSFQGAVAPVPGRGLQEIACSARQAEVLPGVWPGARGAAEVKGPSGAGGKHGVCRPRAFSAG